MNFPDYGLTCEFNPEKNHSPFRELKFSNSITSLKFKNYFAFVIHRDSISDTYLPFMLSFDIMVDPLKNACVCSITLKNKNHMTGHKVIHQHKVSFDQLEPELHGCGT